MPAPPTHHPKKGRGHTPTMGLYGIHPRDPPGPNEGKDGTVSAQAWEAGASLEMALPPSPWAGPHGPPE